MDYGFAVIYDKIYSENNKMYSQLISKLVKRYCRSAKTVLDIGCGTGTVASELAKNFKVIGVDISTEMLKIARRNYPHIEFLKEDIRNFNLNNTFDIVISTNDVLNHFLSLKDINKVFKCVSHHLNKNGVFIFDYNTIQKLKDLQEKTESIFNFYKIGKFYFAYREFKIKKNMIIWEIYYFLPKSKGLYLLHHEMIKEKVFRINQIKNLTKKNNFTLINTVDLSGKKVEEEKSKKVVMIFKKI